MPGIMHSCHDLCLISGIHHIIFLFILLLFVLKGIVCLFFWFLFFVFVVVVVLVFQDRFLCAFGCQETNP